MFKKSFRIGGRKWYPSTNCGNIPKSMLVFLFFILPLVACPLWGQVVQKKKLAGEDYHLWAEMNIDRMSPNEKWVSYTVRYESGLDTLFVRNTDTYKTYSFPKGEGAVFTKEEGFICQTGTDLQICNLKTGKRETIIGVTAFAYANTANQLVVLQSQSAEPFILQIRTPFGKSRKEIMHVAYFVLSPNGEQLLYTTTENNRNAVFLLPLNKEVSAKEIDSNAQMQYSHFTWQKESHAFAFLGQSEINIVTTLFYYNTAKDTLYELNPLTQEKFPKNAAIVYDSTYKIVISDDLQKVFVTIKNKPDNSPDNEKSKVEIWNANDKFIYPVEHINGIIPETVKVAVWKPLEDFFSPVTTIDFPLMMLTGDQKNAVLFNPKDYEPQFEFEGPRDFYILNLETMQQRIFLKKHSGMYQYTLPSPNGKYIAYFKEKNWWVYDIARNAHTNITSKIKVDFFGKVALLASNTAFGNPGWSREDNEVILYDQYDIWAIKPDGSTCKRLTHGRESNIRFRIADIPNEYKFKGNYDGLATDCFDLEKEWFLSAIGEDERTGLYSWKRSTGEKRIVYGDFKTDQLQYSAKKKLVAYCIQDFNHAPAIQIKKVNEKPKSIFQSNSQQQDYFWGKSALIKYQNAKKEDLKGVLYYPANYDPQKKYPMIVHIYEIQSHELHQYSNPTYRNQTGFNPTIFTTQGYFVLLPDIVHEDRNVGGSATDCVLAATTKVISLGLVNPKKIGLMGHSFGGYETIFISNKTQLFATAIASGVITDLTSFYLTFGWNIRKPDMVRFEAEQWRMGTNPIEDPIGFADNSPLSSVDKLNMPLLLWSGGADNHVDWHQSVEYYLALRRLGKKNITLFYPKQGHTITNPIDQKDLTERILQWFGFFLKDEQAPSWISDGLK